jgi:hypothetical protein
MANNHSCDRGADGIIRSIDVVENLTYYTLALLKQKDRDSLNLMILEKTT